MKKKVLSLCLALALCAGLTIPAVAAGGTAIQDSMGNHYTLSHPSVGREDFSTDGCAAGSAYVVPFDTVVTLMDDLSSTVMVEWYAPAGEGTWTAFQYAFLEAAGETVDFHEEVYELIDPNALDTETTDAWRFVGTTEEIGRCLVTILNADNKYLSFIADKNVAPAEPEKPAAPAFTDVPADAYYADAVKWAVEKGITTGKTSTTFAPNETCTRAQIMTFLYRAAGSPKPQTEDNPYTDVSPDAYYYKACQWACDLGAVRRGSFSPNAPCTRQTAVQFIWSASDHPEVKPDCPFTDVDQSSHMSGIINWAVEQGITQGKTATTFAPNDTCTRAQIVTFLYRAFA